MSIFHEVAEIKLGKGKGIMIKFKGKLVKRGKNLVVIRPK